MADIRSVKRFIGVFLVGLVGSPLMCATADAGRAALVTATQAAEEDQDFLFLAEEEPADKTAEEVPDTQDEEVIEKPVKKKKKDKTPPLQAPPDQNPAYTQHKKQEDVISETLPLPAVFCIKKQMGCFYISGKYLAEGFGGQNLQYLNSCFTEDKTVRWKHTFDLSTDAQCHSERYGENIANLKLVIRNAGAWGVPGGVASTMESTVSAAGVTFGSHNHSLNLHVLWVREAWIQAQLNAMFTMPETSPKHFFRAGFFPFSLGKGISLGAAYATGHALVAFYSDYSINQYAPGMLFTGEFVKDRVSYDIYGAILQNFAGSIRSNLEPIYAMEYGHQANPARGPGHVNWLVAARFQLVPLKDPKWGTLEFEPYAFYNQVPEQKIDFPADASAKLGTAGFEIDYEVGGLELSAEFAHNFGRQRVHGWDSNTSMFMNVTGTVVVANSQVTDLTSGQNALVTPANQAIIATVPQSEAQNGQTIPNTSLQNSATRFSDPYTTFFRGWMTVADAIYWFLDKQVGVALGGGIASGDDNPNQNATDPKTPIPDHDYEGFIGLQEFYNGEKVESAYFLGMRTVVRPLSLPVAGIAKSVAGPASTVSEFTNVAYVGTAFHGKPRWKNKMYVRPNLLFFWQPSPTDAFDISTGKVLNCHASPFYGTELNLFFDIFPIDCMKFSLITALFFPGGHFRDVKGIPTSSDQFKLLKSGTSVANRTVGDSTAYFLNARLEYRF